MEDYIEKIEDLYLRDTQMCLWDLRDGYEIPATYFFLFFKQSKQGRSLDRSENSPLQSLLFKDNLNKHLSQI